MKTSSNFASQIFDYMGEGSRCIGKIYLMLYGEIDGRKLNAQNAWEGPWLSRQSSDQ